MESGSRALSRFEVRGKVAVVVGGAEGIGRATCEHLASEGAVVCVLDRNREGAKAVERDIQANGGTAAAFAADVTDEAQLAEAFGQIDLNYGPVEILINSAGLAIRSSAIEMTIADWERVVAVNMTGMFAASRLAARRMMASGRGGSIINVASIMGLSGGLYPNVAYQTTKGGVVNMTRALALEWAAANIRVNAVAPTFVRTGFIAPLLEDKEKMSVIIGSTPLGRIAEPQEVADAILFLASPAAAMITGTILPIDGGFLAR